MRNSYLCTKTTVSMLNYHFVFCPRYRRKIFDIPGVEARFKEITAEQCLRNGIGIIDMECHHDHAHIFLSAPPDLSPSEIMNRVKSYTSWTLRKEFPKLSRMPSLWTRSFFVSTAGSVSAETIRTYVESQKTRA